MSLRTTAFDAAKFLDTLDSQRETLADALATGNPAYISHALDVVARARGVSSIANESGVSREDLFRVLSQEADTGLDLLTGVVEGLRSKMEASTAGEERAKDAVQGDSAMLKTINPLLNADVLYALAAMGHGDDLILCDSNFPAEAIARETVLGHLLHIDAGVARVAEAVLSLFPLDSFVDDAAARMEVVGRPDEVLPIHEEVQAAIDAAEGRSWPLAGVERFSFYERAKKAFCVIRTGERRFYGCFALRKGVIGPDGE